MGDKKEYVMLVEFNDEGLSKIAEKLQQAHELIRECDYELRFSGRIQAKEALPDEADSE